jgi:hypothetical protein
MRLQNVVIGGSYFCYGNWEVYAERKAARDAEAGVTGPSQKFKHRKIQST